MKTFVATLGTGADTFPPIPMAWAAFREFRFHRGVAPTGGTCHVAYPMRVWREEAERRGYDVAESPSVFAWPAGPTSCAVREELRDAVLGDLAAAAPVDLVLLQPNP